MGLSLIALHLWVGARPGAYVHFLAPTAVKGDSGNNPRRTWKICQTSELSLFFFTFDGGINRPKTEWEDDPFDLQLARRITLPAAVRRISGVNRARKPCPALPGALE